MAWCRPGDKPLSEPMMVTLPTHICVARPQWVNTFERFILEIRGNILFFVFHYFVAVWRKDASGKNVPNAHLPIPGVGSERLIEIWKPVNSNQTRWLFSTNMENVWHYTEFVKLYRLWNIYQFTPKPQNIRHPWPVVYGLTTIPSRISNYIHYKVWDKIAYPFPNCNSCAVEVWNV